MAHVIKLALVVALIASSLAILVYPVVTRGKWIKDAASENVSPRIVTTVMLGFTLGSIVTLTVRRRGRHRRRRVDAALSGAADAPARRN